MKSIFTLVFTALSTYIAIRILAVFALRFSGFLESSHLSRHCQFGPGFAVDFWGHQCAQVSQAPLSTAKSNIFLGRNCVARRFVCASGEA